MIELMYSITLTDEEFASLRQEVCTCSDPKTCKKLHAILLAAQYVQRKIICKHLGITKNTLLAYIKLFLAEGLNGLQRNKYHRPSSPLENHAATLEEYFDTHPPHSVHQAIEVIERLTKLQYKKSFVHQWLVSKGYRFRKTGGIPATAEVSVQEDFKKNARTLDFVGSKR